MLDATTVLALRQGGIANAAFIVRACNAHDELVAALGMIERLLSSHCESNQADQSLDDDALTVARAALAKVTPANDYQRTPQQEQELEIMRSRGEL